MPASRWPTQVVQDLQTRYFGESAVQIGVDQTNDFIFGGMHAALRRLLFDGIAATRSTTLFHSPNCRHRDGPAAPWASRSWKPDAVRRAERAFFPSTNSARYPHHAVRHGKHGSDPKMTSVKKRLMVVPNCHVTHLETATAQGAAQVTAIDTNQGQIQLPQRGVVVLAAGTIESTRLALDSFGGTIGYDLIGKNLISHMRSNYSFRLPRAVVPALAGKDLQASACS